MPGVIPRLKWLWIPVLLAVAVVLASATAASALENAGRYIENTNNIDGASASIETDDPSVGSGWAYHRVVVQEEIGSDIYFVEIGWVKGYHTANNPTVYGTWRNIWGGKGEYWGGEPSVGTSYNYQVKNTSGNVWALYYNNLSSSVSSRNMGWSVGDRAFGAGETMNSSISMGDVDYDNVSYLVEGDSSWTCSCNATDMNTEPSQYEVLGASSSDDWRVRDIP